MPLQVKKIVSEVREAVPQSPDPLKKAQTLAELSGGTAYALRYKGECFKHVNELLNVTKETKSDALLEAVEVYIALLKAQDAVFKTMAACKEPANKDFMAVVAKNSKKAFFDIGKKDRKFMLHFRVLEDSVNLYCWF